MELNNIKFKGAHVKKMSRRPFHKQTPHKKFTAPTVGLEHAVFDFGTTKNAAEF